MECRLSSLFILVVKRCSRSSMSGRPNDITPRAKLSGDIGNNRNAQAHGPRRGIGEIVMIAGQVVDLRASSDEPQQLLDEPRNIQQLYFARVDPGFERFVDLRLRKHR